MKCSNCGGWTYVDPPFTEKADRWCLMCGEWQKPNGFKPLPYLAHLDTSTRSDWAIDKYGNIVDVIDTKIATLVDQKPVVTVTSAARFASCSTGEARYSLQKLLKEHKVEFFYYGPQSRWSGYRKVTDQKVQP